MTTPAAAAVDQLRRDVAGDVLVPGDAGYDEARRVWNADIDRRPAVVVRCAGTDDVRAAVLHARAQGLEIAVRGGAHSISGMSVVDDGMMIDLSRMNGVVVDAEARRARVGGGALLGDLDAAAQEHGLAAPAGTVSHTGVGGLTLGGGMGWLTRKHGLTIDNMLSAEVVTADGRVLRASQDEHADLFWALRGGGGNFGVVTEFELALHPVGPLVQFGMLFWALDEGREALRACRDVVTSLPDDVNVLIVALNAPPEPFVPPQHHGAPGFAVLVAGFGDPEEHERVVQRFRDGRAPLWELVTPLPYVALQQLVDHPNDWGQYDYDKALYLEDLSDGAIDVLLQHVPDKTSPTSVVLLMRLDGAYSAVADDATAFSGGRSPRYNVFIIAVCPTPDVLQRDREWVRRLHDGLTPHALPVEMYVNAFSGPPDEDRVRAAYGSEKYDRLARIKAQYDPENLFRRNANVRPAGRTPVQRMGHPLDEGAALDPA